jgi:monovalent cation:H+ antiporter, CPA1 family
VKIRYIIGPIAIGLLYGYFKPGQFTYAFGHATLYIFLPPLLFEAAWNLNYRVMRRMFWPIAILAGPGVALTALIVTGALLLVRMPLAMALLTGAILSATDPISVVAIFRRLPVPRSLSTIVESEALFNEAVAVVIYQAVLLVVTTTATMSQIGVAAAVAFVGSIAGILVGIAVASLAAASLRNRNNATLQIVATIISAYGAYFIADAFNASGIFATITCGIALRLYERAWITVTIVDDVERFWEVGAFAANVLVFFLAGAAFDLGSAARNSLYAVAAFAGAAAARFALAALLLPAGYPREWLDVIRSAGMRGALPLALALALPPSVAGRSAIVATTFAIVIATIVASTITVPHVVQRVARRSVRVSRPERRLAHRRAQ